jgi:hypothetical protein
VNNNNIHRYRKIFIGVYYSSMPSKRLSPSLINSQTKQALKKEVISTIGMNLFNRKAIQQEVCSMKPPK